MSWALLVLIITSIIMKYTWYDRLGPGEMYTAEDTGQAVTDAKLTEAE
jgi:hypothetical protein